ncbi:MAG: DUF2516 family protein [Actinomycetes bacterium]
MFGNVQDLVLLALWVITLALKGYAFIDCLRRPQQAFPAVGRQTKILWLAITAIAALTGLLPSMTLNLIGIAGTVVALVYLFDVRTKIIDITSNRW